MLALSTTPVVVHHPVAHVRHHHHSRDCNRKPFGTWSPREVRCVTVRIFRHDGPAAVRFALAVEACESGFRVRDRLGTAQGPWQVKPEYHPDAPNVYDPIRITWWVHGITHRHGWSAWQCAGMV